MNEIIPINFPKTANGCPCGERSNDSNNNNKGRTGNRLTLWNAFVTVRLHLSVYSCIIIAGNSLCSAGRGTLQQHDLPLPTATALKDLVLSEPVLSNKTGISPTGRPKHVND